MQLTRNFSLKEFTESAKARELGIDNTPSDTHLAAMKALCENILQPLRDDIRRVMVVSSGYRSPALNSAIGGSKTSQHSLGQAADIKVAGMDALVVCQHIIRMNLPFDQLIYEGAWTHVSFGPRNRRQVLRAHFLKGHVTYTAGLA